MYDGSRRVRNDLFDRDTGRRIPVWPKDHVLHCFDKDWGLVIERLADDDIHAQRLGASRRIRGPEAKQRDVHEDVRRLGQLGQPAHPLHRELDLPHALRQRHVDGPDRTDANDAVDVHDMTGLERLHRGDQGC